MIGAARPKSPQSVVRAMYRKLARSWGPQHWWPAETSFEVIVGAILTQNTSWTNVERALDNLRSAELLDVAGIRAVALDELEKLVRPSGYFRQKAARLKMFVAFLDAEYGGSLEKMFTTATATLRQQFLALKGIGPETADSILLYAGAHEVFVVDAYTRRVLERHGVLDSNAKYDDIRELMEQSLSTLKFDFASPAKSTTQERPAIHLPSAMSRAQRAPRAQVFNEMHGLIVQVGKHYCHKSHPKCELCPLRSLLPSGTPLAR